MKINKFFAIVLAVILICSANIICYAEENELEENIVIETACINSEGQFDKEIENENNVALICCDDINENNIDILKEYIDNGTDVFTDDSNTSELADIFDSSYSQLENEEICLGNYIQTFGNDYIITPITIDVINENTGESMDISNTDLINIKNNFDYQQLNNDLQMDIYDSEFLNAVSDNDLAILQSSTVIGNSYAECSVFKYFLKKGSETGTGTTYQYNNSKNVSGWSCIGSIRINGYAIKIKTVSTKTYDDIYAVVTASSSGKKYVTRYKFSMNVYGSSTNTTNILDETYLKGDSNETVTTSIASGFSSDGKSTITNTTSYSYSPNGQRIVNYFGEEKERTWTAYPKSTKCEPISWKISPSIAVCNTKGTTTNTKINMYVSDFQLKGSVRTYTIQDTCITGMTFKDHKSV